MLTDPSIEKLKAKSASPYDLAVLVSKRARELTDGAQPMVDDTDAANVVSLACREVAADKIVAVEGDVSKEAVIPITREERIRRIEEEKARERQLEEERLERSG
nr:DNA-directed RNA polymerase subunit omega [Saccharofermentans sp.]